MFDKTLITPLNIPAAIEKLLKNASELKSSFPKKNSDPKKKKKSALSHSCNLYFMMILFFFTVAFIHFY